MLSERTSWMRRMEGVLTVWRDIQSAYEHEFLRDFHGFLHDAPDRDLLSGLAVTPPRRFENLLQVQAYECAVLELLSPRSSFMMSRSPDGVHMATVVLEGHNVEGTAKARTGGLALAGAILLTLNEANALDLPSTAVPRARLAN